MDIRTAILNRLKVLGWSKYKLAKEMKGHATTQGVYQYLNGTNGISVRVLEKMLGVLGLMVATAIVERPCGNEPVAKKPLKKQAKSRRRVAD